MPVEPDIARIAATIGDASRIRMLVLLMEGRALTAKELALGAGIEPGTATSHLKRLVDDGLLESAAQGRHKYFRFASEQVAQLVESLMRVAPKRPSQTAAKADEPIRRARFCYDHLAGSLGTGLLAMLPVAGQPIERDWYVISLSGRAMPAAAAASGVAAAVTVDDLKALQTLPAAERDAARGNADLNIAQILVRVPEGADAAVADKGDRHFGVMIGQNLVDRRNDAGLGIDCPFPAVKTLVGMGKEPVRGLFEFGGNQESGGRAVVLAHVVADLDLRG